MCWTHGFTYALCCDVEDVHTAMYERQVRGGLLLTLAEIDEALLEQRDFGHELAAVYRNWSTGVGRAAVGVAAVAAALLRALLPGAGPAAAREALAQVLSPGTSIVAQLRSGWPLFALLAILSAQKWRPQNSSGGGDGQGACLLGCSASQLRGLGCAEGCFAAASVAALPPRFKLLGRPKAQVAVEGLRGVLLEAGEAALHSAGRAAALSRGRSCWLQLHRLQAKLHLVASCPAASVLYRTNAEPPFDVCLPRPSAHDRDNIVMYGRWRDCDLLKDAAIFGGMSGCISSMWGRPSDPLCAAVDVGSALGACSGYLLAMGFRVYAIEPVAGFVALLRGAAWEAEAQGLLLAVTAKASNETTAASAAHAAERGLRHGRSPTWSEWIDGQQPAPTVRLDDLLMGEPGPILVKVDVEGDELAVLRGAVGLFLEGRVRAVLLELHCGMLRERGADPWEPLGLLEGHGFHLDVRYPPIYAGAPVTRASLYEILRVVRERKELENLQVLAALPLHVPMWPERPAEFPGAGSSGNT